MAKPLASNGNEAIGANSPPDTIDCPVTGHWGNTPRRLSRQATARVLDFALRSRHYGPMLSITVNGRPRTLSPPSSTLADLVRELDIEGKRIAVEKNGEIVPKSRYAATRLSSGDRIEIVGAVGGG
jgi:sulfur carrier protein